MHRIREKSWSAGQLWPLAVTPVYSIAGKERTVCRTAGPLILRQAWYTLLFLFLDFRRFAELVLLVRSGAARLALEPPGVIPFFRFVFEATHGETRRCGVTARTLEVLARHVGRAERSPNYTSAPKNGRKLAVTGGYGAVFSANPAGRTRASAAGRGGISAPGATAADLAFDSHSLQRSSTTHL